MVRIIKWQKFIIQHCICMTSMIFLEDGPSSPYQIFIFEYDAQDKNRSHGWLWSHSGDLEDGPFKPLSMAHRIKTRVMLWLQSHYLFWGNPTPIETHRLAKVCSWVSIPVGTGNYLRFVSVFHSALIKKHSITTYLPASIIYIYWQELKRKKNDNFNMQRTCQCVKFLEGMCRNTRMGKGS